MPFDGITSHIIASELDSLLTGARIDKVFQPDRQTVILHIRANSKMEKLLISCNPAAVRMNLTTADRENPKMPSSFCMLLRKYLAGAKIESITCPDYERIFEIKASNTDELHDRKTYTLVCELMGRLSNIILINQTGKIIDSLVHVDMSVNRYREIMPARIYAYPPSQDKMLPEESLQLIRSNNLPVKQTELGRSPDKALLNSLKGFSPSLARRIANECGLDDRTPIRLLSDEEQKRFTNTCKEFLERLLNKDYSPAIYYSNDREPSEYSPFVFHTTEQVKKFNTVSEAIDRFYESKDKAADLDRKKNRLTAMIDSALSHSVKKLHIHEKDYKEGQNAEYYKKCADLILSNTYRIDEHASSVICEDYYEDPPCSIEIRLDPAHDASYNAQDYYKRFRKAKRKFTLADEYIKADREAISYFRTLKAAITSASCEEDITALEMEIINLTNSNASAKKAETPKGDPNKMVGMAKTGKRASRAMREAARKAQQKAKQISQRKPDSKPLSYRKYMTSDGYEILSGRNNIQNDELTFKIASKDDWWFHVKGLPGTHVILKSHKGEEFPSDNAVLEAASLAVFFSKSIMLEEHSEASVSNAGQIKAEVDYCPVSHVKKIPGARPGMVIYESYYSELVPAKEPSAN